MVSGFVSEAAAGIDHAAQLLTPHIIDTTIPPCTAGPDTGTVTVQHSRDPECGPGCCVSLATADSLVQPCVSLAGTGQLSHASEVTVSAAPEPVS